MSVRVTDPLMVSQTTRKWRTATRPPRCPRWLEYDSSNRWEMANLPHCWRRRQSVAGGRLVLTARRATIRTHTGTAHLSVSDSKCPLVSQTNHQRGMDVDLSQCSRGLEAVSAPGTCHHSGKHIIDLVCLHAYLEEFGWIAQYGRYIRLPSIYDSPMITASQSLSVPKARVEPSTYFSATCAVNPLPGEALGHAQLYEPSTVKAWARKRGGFGRATMWRFFKLEHSSKEAR